MADQIENKIKRLELANFTCFSKTSFDFSPNINVIVGENGTGKTHLLKVMYAALCQLSYGTLKQINITPDQFELALREVFNINDSSILVREDEQDGIIGIEYFGDDRMPVNVKVHKNIEALNEPQAKYINTYKNPVCLYLPPQEMLSWNKGFSSLYLNREVDFDRTYFDLSNSLNLPLKRGGAIDLKNVLEKLESEISIKVSQKEGRFFIKFIKTGHEYRATVVAQGINKIAQLIYLIKNGSLTKDTILFWDEPEANLNPKYITLVAKFIQTLANAGVQIFLASHDYLLVHELSLLSEYKKEMEIDGQKTPDVKFFGLYKGKDGSTKVEEGRSMADLQNDAILEEFSAHDAREEALFKKPYQKE